MKIFYTFLKNRQKREFLSNKNNSIFTLKMTCIAYNHFTSTATVKK